MHLLLYDIHVLINKSINLLYRINDIYIYITDESKELPADIRYTVFCTAVSNGKDSDWTFLWNRFLNLLDSPSEKSDILSALSCTKEIWILQVP